MKSNRPVGISDPYKLFRRLTSALDIRQFGRGRDNLLYESLRNKLDMGREKPKEFFRDHSEVNEQRVLEAFMKVFEPFVLMVEEIYSTLGALQQQASGGNDFRITYDFDSSSLDFNLEAFREFEKQRVATRFEGWSVRHDSDAAPGLRYEIERLIELRLSSWARTSRLEPIEESELIALLDDIRGLSSSHLSVLNRVLRDWEAARFDISTELLLSRYAIENAEYIRNADALRNWREYAEFAVKTIPQVDVRRIFESCTPEQILSQYESLRWMRDRLGERQNQENYAEILLEFLALPYWKKRWQVFEIWVFILALQGIKEHKVDFDVDDDGRLVLKTGESEAPRARIELNVTSHVEIWTEFPLEGKGRRGLRPDIAITMNKQGANIPVGVIECKQRESENDKVLLRDASKYSRLLTAGARCLLVNYDSFKGPTLSNGYRLVDKGVETLFLDGVQPNTPGKQETIDFVTSLAPVPILAVTFVVDTTGSMHSYLSRIWETTSTLSTRLSETQKCLFGAVLFGDHGADEPYVTKEFPLTTDASKLIGELNSAPTTSGGDVPEAVEDAIHSINLVASPELSHRAVFVFLDSPPHDISGCPNAIDFEKEVTGLLSCAQVWVINCGSTSWEELGWSRFATNRNLNLSSLEQFSQNIASVNQELSELRSPELRA